MGQLMLNWKFYSFQPFLSLLQNNLFLEALTLQKLQKLTIKINFKNLILLILHKNEQKYSIRVFSLRNLTLTKVQFIRRLHTKTPKTFNSGQNTPTSKKKFSYVQVKLEFVHSFILKQATNRLTPGNTINKAKHNYMNCFKKFSAISFFSQSFCAKQRRLKVLDTFNNLKKLSSILIAWLQKDQSWCFEPRFI